MSTFSPTLFSVHAKRIALESTSEALEAQATAPADDGLGCMRGLAVVMLLNVVFLLTILAGWELWRHLR